MTVAELIKALSKLPADAQIILGSDDEGNDFVEPYFPRESWCVEDEGYRCGYYPVDDEDVESGEYEDYELVKMVVM